MIVDGYDGHVAKRLQYEQYRLTFMKSNMLAHRYTNHVVKYSTVINSVRL